MKHLFRADICLITATFCKKITNLISFLPFLRCERLNRGPKFFVGLDRARKLVPLATGLESSCLERSAAAWFDSIDFTVLVMPEVCETQANTKTPNYNHFAIFLMASPMPLHYFKCSTPYPTSTMRFAWL
jgi:hypothetical protein